MQDEHEQGNNGVGVARPGADADAEGREPEPGSDRRVLTVERADRVHQRPARRTIPVGVERVLAARKYGSWKLEAGPGAGVADLGRGWLRSQ